MYCHGRKLPVGNPCHVAIHQPTMGGAPAERRPGGCMAARRTDGSHEMKDSLS